MGRKASSQRGWPNPESCKDSGAKEQNGTSTLRTAGPQTQVHKEVLKPNRREGNQKKHLCH